MVRWQKTTFNILSILVRVLTKWQKPTFYMLSVLVIVLARWQKSDKGLLLLDYSYWSEHSSDDKRKLSKLAKILAQ